MHRILLICILCCLCSEARAEAQAVIGPQDVLRGTFTEEKRLTGFNGPLISSGHFTIAPRYGLIWDVEKPFASTTVITPNGLVQLVGGKKITELSAQKIPFMIHLYGMLGGAMAGDWHALQSDFEVSQSTDGATLNLTLVPHQRDDPMMPYDIIYIKAEKFVDQVVMQKKDSGIDKLIFSDNSLSHQEPNKKEQAAFAAVQP